MWVIFQICFFFKVRHDHLDRLQYSYEIKKNEVWNYKATSFMLTTVIFWNKKKKKGEQPPSRCFEGLWNKNKNKNKRLFGNLLILWNKKNLLIFFKMYIFKEISFEMIFILFYNR